MGDTTDGDSDNMAWQDVTRKRKGRNDSSGSSISGLEVSNMVKKVKASEKEDEETDWKVMITFKNEGGHFHLLKLTKAIEKEMGKIKFAKYLSNKRLLIFAKNQQQRDKLLKAKTLNGERISAHSPGNAAKLHSLQKKRCYL